MTELARLFAVSAVAAVTACAFAAAAGAVTDFRTANKQIYCGVVEAYEMPPGYRAPLTCWRPSNGFTVFLSALHGTSTKWNPRNKAPNQFAVRVLRIGRDWWSTKGYSGLVRGPRQGVVYRCFNRTHGLTCVNRAGHGFWLGSEKGFSRL